MEQVNPSQFDVPVIKSSFPILLVIIEALIGLFLILLLFVSLNYFKVISLSKSFPALSHISLQLPTQQPFYYSKPLAYSTIESYIKMTFTPAHVPSTFPRIENILPRNLPQANYQSLLFSTNPTFNLQIRNKSENLIGTINFMTRSNSTNYLYVIAKEDKPVPMNFDGKCLNETAFFTMIGTFFNNVPHDKHSLCKFFGNSTITQSFYQEYFFSENGAAKGYGLVLSQPSRGAVELSAYSCMMPQESNAFNTANNCFSLINQ